MSAGAIPSRAMRRSPIPMYYQIMEQIRGKILNGDLGVGDALPPERELVDLYHVSRMTVRQAISELVNEGILIRRQGIGTFVAPPKIEQELNQLTSFTEDMERRGMKAGARLLSCKEKPATRAVMEALKLIEDERVYECVRLRLADDEPMALETTSLPVTICPGMCDEDLEHHSLYTLLRERWEIMPFRATQTIEPVSATAHEAEMLHVSSGTPMLLMYRTTYDQDGRPFEFVKSIYRGDRYKFIIELYQSRVVVAEAPVLEHRLVPS